MLEKKISWIAWDKVLASKKKGGLGVSSYFALNRALLLKWVWRFVLQDDSLWFRVIQAVHGDKIDSHSVRKVSIWSSILKEVQVLKSSGFDFLSYCSKRIGDGQSTSFWKETWMGIIPLCEFVREVLHRGFAVGGPRDRLFPALAFVLRNGRVVLSISLQEFQYIVFLEGCFYVCLVVYLGDFGNRLTFDVNKRSRSIPF
ncbi:hypothetical protein Tco_1352816 [Tanacetum coccineum]